MSRMMSPCVASHKYTLLWRATAKRLRLLQSIRFKSSRTKIQKLDLTSRLFLPLSTKMHWSGTFPPSSSWYTCVPACQTRIYHYHLHNPIDVCCPVGRGLTEVISEIWGIQDSVRNCWDVSRLCWGWCRDLAVEDFQIVLITYKKAACQSNYS